MVRRKPGQLLAIELSILETAIEMTRGNDREFHGFALAHGIAERDGARSLTAHGTLYKALSRMETAGLLASRWEDAELAVDQGRPRRRLYRVTPHGASTAAEAGAPQLHSNVRPGLVT
jgi:PadR family transcriptional regulator, regulatory protein PadR